MRWTLAAQRGHAMDVGRPAAAAPLGSMHAESEPSASYFPRHVLCSRTLDDYLFLFDSHPPSQSQSEHFATNACL
eukprot:513066-Pleurochrysis_carterae.AAC.4